MAKKNKKVKDLEKIQKLLDDAWLGIDVEDEHIFNPLKEIPEQLEENPHLYITWLLSRPEYFSLFCDQILNIKLLPVQALILEELWHRKFPILIASRGFSKSFMLAIYAILRALFLPGRKVVICGAAFRQSKVIFNYIMSIYNNAPILRDIVMYNKENGPRFSTDMWTFSIDNSIISALPIGNGEKIRGQRAHDILTDEFASIPREIFEIVIAGFANVKAAPIDGVRLRAAMELAKKMKVYDIFFGDQEKEEQKLIGNQIVFSGTAYYDFNHFSEYWKKWKQIIMSKGNKETLQNIFNDEVPEDFDWRDFSVTRIPIELIPKGFMDEGQVARARATTHSGNYIMEYGACFSNDSNGFFKRSLIEHCVLTTENPIVLPDGPVWFKATLDGNSRKKYVMGIDPAADDDNFAIVVIELNKGHRRIVYSWTTNKKEQKEKVKKGLIYETDYYSYCAKKIRELMYRFNVERIAMDAQGGGGAVLEALQDKDKMIDGEQPILPIIDPDNPQDSDMEHGIHIVHMIEFANAKWVSDANHGLKKDFEDRVCIFPFFDSLTIGLSAETDIKQGKSYDTLEDCVLEIEELKNELTTIVMSQTPSGRDKWDTPEIKLPNQKKGRLRKDRYSALLLANSVARELQKGEVSHFYVSEGGWAEKSSSREDQSSTSFYQGPPHIVQQLQALYN